MLVHLFSVSKRSQKTGCFERFQAMRDSVPRLSSLGAQHPLPRISDMDGLVFIWSLGFPSSQLH